MFTATLYNKTGFTLFNVPDCEYTLYNAASSRKSVPAMDILQLLYNTKFTIRASESDVMYADYLKLVDGEDPGPPSPPDPHVLPNGITAAFYVINGYTMTSGDTVELDVTMEPLLTCNGIYGIRSNYVTDGIVTRYNEKIRDKMWKSVAQASDEDDPLFSPAYPTKIVPVGKAFEIDYNNRVSNLVFATFSVDPDIAASFRYDIETSEGLKTYVDEGLITNDPLNFVIPGKYTDQLLETSGTGGAVSAYTGKFRLIQAASDMLDFKKDLARLIAVNMQDIVQDVYIVPEFWYAPVAPSGIAGAIKSSEIDVSGFIPSDTERYNAQPYIGKWNGLIFVATGSGDSQEMPLSQMFLHADDDGIKGYINGFADPRPDGGVDFAVAQKGDTLHDRTEGAIIEYKSKILHGGNWYKIPIQIIGNGGAAYANKAFNAERTHKDLSAYENFMYGLESSLNTPGGESLSVPAALNPQQDLPSITNPLYAAAKVKDSFGMSSLLNYIDASGNIDYGAGIAGGNDRIKALYDREIERSLEVAQYNKANAPHPTVITSPTGDFDPYGYNVVIFRRQLDDRDIQRYNALINRFGARHTALFDVNMLKSREKFNYIEGQGIIFCNPHYPKELNKRLSDAFNGGMRIWHTKPSTSYYAQPSSNPNAT